MIQYEYGKDMGKFVSISAKVPKELYNELILRISEGERSAFVRDAIMEKLQKVPRSNRILDLERRVIQLETGFSELRNHLAKLEVFTVEKGKINPHTFGIDGTDHKIIDCLLHYKGMTTPELAEQLKTNRWLVLNRLRKIQRESKMQLGESVVKYYAGERRGKKRAWWLNEELIDS